MKKSRPKKDVGSDSDSCNENKEFNNNTQIDPNHPSNLHLAGISGKSLLKVSKAKLGARPELGRNNLWSQHKYYKNFETKWPVNDPTCPNNIEYVDMNKISVIDFEKRFIKNKIPCIMLNATNDWDAQKKWSVHRILKKYRNQTMKCGEDDEGNNVKLKIKYYIDYMNTTKDDSPLYIFDANYGEHSKNKRLLEDYKIPEPFQDDIFKYISNRRRPPYRWFVMGPARSGTGVHIDPLGTSAWNALIVGHKRWFICSTEVDPDLIKVNSQESKYQRDEAITWFDVKRQKALNSIPKSSKVIEVIQKPNEVMFIPSGWWHAVLNLDTTIAVTQNLAHREHFSVNYHKSARARPKMTTKLVQTLKIQRPELYKMTKTVDLTKSSGQASSSSSDDSSSSSSSSESESEESVNRMKRCSGNSKNGLVIKGKISLRNVSSSPSRKREKLS